MRTIGASEAVASVQKLVDIRTSKADLDQVLQVRNGIVHAGIAPRLEITEKIRLFVPDDRTNFDVPAHFYDEGPWSL